ncbi:MAG: hypothetical protein JKY96_05960 [Phycisphaerales bacterium]|nr:hypothetical protein [Phycisphaerales bacterium]
MPRSVVLLHTTPDDGSHFDWMIEGPGDHERRLLTWRCVQRPDTPSWDGRGKIITPHRAAYLDFEGDLGNARGCVVRKASGEVLALAQDHGMVKVTIRWDDCVLGYHAEPAAAGGECVFCVRRIVE